MRLGFFRRERARMLHFGRANRKVFAAAAEEADGQGIDSLDLLVAVLGISHASRVVRALGADPRAIQSAARQARIGRDPEPGLSLDAKVVVEVVAHQAVLAGRDSGITDLLVALAGANCLARQVLEAHGIDATGLAAQVGGAKPG